eukprot:s2269_g7.t2
MLAVPCESVSGPESVFWVTAAFSIFAYLWLVLIVQVISPNIIEVWEERQGMATGQTIGIFRGFGRSENALVTLGWLPVLILVSYLTDIGWFSGVRKQPLVEKPVSLSSDGQVPLATTSSGGLARQVWRHDLKRSKDYPDFTEDTSCSQSDDSSRGSEPVVVLDPRGVPYQNVYGVITFSDDTFLSFARTEFKVLCVASTALKGSQRSLATTSQRWRRQWQFREEISRVVQRGRITVSYRTSSAEKQTWLRATAETALASSKSCAALDEGLPLS